MSIVTCPACLSTYEDTYRFTFCPHDAFAANNGDNTFTVHHDALLVPGPDTPGLMTYPDPVAVPASLTTLEPPKHHTLVITFDGNVGVSVECPNTGPERECGSWRETTRGEPCICTCDGCVADGPDVPHHDCDQDAIEDIGPKWCKARPENECWYVHALREVGAADMLAGELRVPVKLSGYSWEEPIDVELITETRPPDQVEP